MEYYLKHFHRRKDYYVFYRQKVTLGGSSVSDKSMWKTAQILSCSCKKTGLPHTPIYSLIKLPEIILEISLLEHTLQQNHATGSHSIIWPVKALSIIFKPLKLILGFLRRMSHYNVLYFKDSRPSSLPSRVERVYSRHLEWLDRRVKRIWLFFRKWRTQTHWWVHNLNLGYFYKVCFFGFLSRFLRVGLQSFQKVLIWPKEIFLFEKIKKIYM